MDPHAPSPGPSAHPSPAVLPLIRPPRLRSGIADETAERHATWLELLYDLILVLAVAQVAHLLAGPLSWSIAGTALALFVPVWWVWCGHTVYANRFDSDDLVHRLATFTQMFALLGMAIEVHHAAEGHLLGFGCAYLTARGVLIALLVRAYVHLPAARSTLLLYLPGFGVGFLLWGIGLCLHGPAQLLCFALSLGLDLATPWVLWWQARRSGTANLSRSHLPERLGLFTLIVLGESFTSVAVGIKDTRWDPVAVAAAACAFIAAIGVWWIYFSHLERALGRVPIGSGQPYIYGHLPTQLAIIALSTGFLHGITEHEAGHLPQSTLLLLTGGMAGFVLGGGLLHAITHAQEFRRSWLRYVVLAAICPAVFALGLATPPLVPLAAAALFFVGLACVDEATRRRSG